MENLSGLTFTRLTVTGKDGVRRVFKNSSAIYWECTCICGNKKMIAATALKAGITKSCGCYMREVNRGKKNNLKHGSAGKGDNRVPEYDTWYNIRYRCYNRNCPQFKNWGGRGITVCKRWRDSFENFISDMGYRPTPKHSLDRFPDINGNYEPSNCRWATKLEQARGYTTNVHFEINGVKMIQKDWAYYFKVSDAAIIHHLKSGKSFQEIYNYYTNKNKLNGVSI